MSGQDGLFSRLQWSQANRIWVMDVCRAGSWDRVPVTDLVGERVNVGDKDGGVYEGVTVAAFDEKTGHLVLEGGVTGSALRPEEARPLEEPLRLWAHDVARGRIA